MREILFRAYIKTLKWIVPVERINFDCETVEVDLTDGNGDIAEYDFDEVVLMQYTGLTDKNGTKIFEGDIVSVNVNGRNTVCTVSWADVVAHFQLWQYNTIPNTPTHLNLGNFDCEVIGNIHDNPELMKGGTEWWQGI